MILVVVYVGAVAVLFLFVVMMLDVDFAELRPASSRTASRCTYRPGDARRLIPLRGWRFAGTGSAAARRAGAAARSAHQHRGARPGLYTDYVFFFEVAGLILLVAMIGAIVLTLRHKEGVKRQSIPAQNARGNDGHGGREGR